MFKRLFALGLIVALAVAFFPLVATISERSDLPALATAYLSSGPGDLGAANLVTSVVVTYRGLDTLGEVTVLFAAAAGVSLAFSRMRREGDNSDEERGPSGAPVAHDSPRLPGDRPPSELVETGAGLLLPLIFLFGIFIFVNGHLTPGGGFQGGVVIAGGVLLTFLAGTLKELSHGALSALETVAGAGYVAVGLLGVWLAAGFLDPRWLPAGEIGTLFSAGAIPVIYSLVGIKVGAELSGLIDAMRRRSVAP